MLTTLYNSGINRRQSKIRSMSKINLLTINPRRKQKEFRAQTHYDVKADEIINSELQPECH